MLKRYLLCTGVLVFFTLLLLGCGQDPVQAELLDYLNNRLPALDAIESKIISDYDSVTGPNYTNDEETYAVLTEKVIPDYRGFIIKLEEMQLQTQELEELHDLYIVATNKQYNAIVQITAALENQDTNLVVAANEKLSEGRKGIRDFHSKLQALAAKHNIEIQN